MGNKKRKLCKTFKVSSAKPRFIEPDSARSKRIEIRKADKVQGVFDPGMSETTIYSMPTT